MTTSQNKRLNCETLTWLLALWEDWRRVRLIGLHNATTYIGRAIAGSEEDLTGG